MNKTSEFILAALADACNIERSKLQGSTPLAEIGFDSLSAVSLTYQVESRYGVELDQDRVVQLYEAATVADVVALVDGILDVSGERAVSG